MSDIEMPAIDGVTLVQKIRGHPTLASLKVIMFSSLINEHTIKKCAAAGADAWTRKPYMTDLAELIDEHLIDQKEA